MAFESGSLGYRAYVLPRALPEDAVARFARHAAPPLESLGAGLISGWVTGRHLLDRQITRETAYHGGYLRLTLMEAQRRVPAALLRAECRMEELALQAAQGRDFVKRQERAEIIRSVTERLLPNMPPQIKGCPMVYHAHSGLLYAAALSARQNDLLVARFSGAVGFAPIPLLPETAAAQRKKCDVREWAPVSFAPDIDDAQMESAPGRDFLTWLWFAGETRGGTLAVPGVGEVALLVEGPLLFLREGRGAHQTLLRLGEPTGSAEAKTCLLGGKKLKQARLTFARGDEQWQVTFDADEFLCRGVRLPERREAVGPVARFEARMVALDELQQILLAAYDQFVDERQDAATWKRTRAAMRQWVRDRAARA